MLVTRKQYEELKKHFSEDFLDDVEITDEIELDHDWWYYGNEPVKKKENLERFKKPDLRPKPEKPKEKVLGEDGWKK